MKRPEFMWEGRNIFLRPSKIRIAEREVPNKFGQTKAIFFKGEPYKGRTTENFAYVGFPATPMPEGGYPAVVLAHGGGGGAFYEWVEYWNGKGYAAIAPDFYGNQYGHLGKNPKENNPLSIQSNCPSGSYCDDKNTARDGWLYHAVSNCILCFNVLRDSGRVNVDKIAMTGISWGSVVTCVTSGVDDRFKAFVPVYGGGFIYRSKSFMLEEPSYVPPKDEEEWISLFDPITYLPYNDKPTMFTFGSGEDCFSPFNNQLSADMIKGKAYFAIKETLHHDHRWRDDDEMCHVHAFINYIINDVEMPFEVDDAVSDGKNISVTVKNHFNVKKAKLVYIKNIHDIFDGKWKWSSNAATFNGEKFVAKIPDGSKAAFMQFSNSDREEDKNTEFILSTKIFFNL